MVKPGYKQTEVGIIPNTWQVISLQNLCIQNGIVRGPFGGALKKEIFVAEGYKVYEQGNAIYKTVTRGSYYIDAAKYNKMLRFSVREGDFIVSCSGTIGMIFQIPINAPKGIINQALLKLTINDAVVNPQYFYLYFSCDSFTRRIVDDTQGGAMKNLVGMDVFRNTPFPLPPMPEQKNISIVLADITDLITNLEAIIAKKKAIKQGTMQELLTGKRRLPGFFGEWETRTLHEISNEMVDGPFGSNLKTEHYTTERQVRIIQLSNIGEAGWNNANVKYTTFSHAAELQRCIVQPGSVLIAKMMPAGRAIICPDNEKSYILGSDVVKVVPNSRVDSRYLVYATKSRFYLDQIADDTQGSTRARTSVSKLRKTAILFPKKDEQIAIADILSEMDMEIAALEGKLAKYRQVKQSMMQQLLTGKIRLV